MKPYVRGSRVRSFVGLLEYKDHDLLRDILGVPAASIYIADPGTWWLQRCFSSRQLQQSLKMSLSKKVIRQEMKQPTTTFLWTSREIQIRNEKESMMCSSPHATERLSDG